LKEEYLGKLDDDHKSERFLNKLKEIWNEKKSSGVKSPLIKTILKSNQCK
jgi:hypothetical protein